MTAKYDDLRLRRVRPASTQAKRLTDLTEFGCYPVSDAGQDHATYFL